MKQFLVITLLTAVMPLAVFGADAPKPGGFLPVTPDGYLIGTSNPAPAAARETPALRPVVPAPIRAGTNAASAAATAVTSSPELDERHKLAAGDKVSFTILEDRYLPNLADNRAAVSVASANDLSKALVVADTGELDVPYVGRVMVAGRSCKDVAAEVKVLLEKDYYYRATVILGLDQMSRTQGRVYISGEVRSPGPVLIPPNENFTVGKAILGAGGFTEWAKKTKVQVVRAPKPGQPATDPITVDMEQVLEKARADKDVPLNPEDYIIVPRATWHM